MTSREIIGSYVALHNEGVATGSFAPMLALFDDDAELYFEDLPIGPYLGRNAIAEAFCQLPPTDELEILEISSYDSGGRAIYGWQSDPGRAAGDIHMDINDGRIRKLTIRTKLQ